LAFFFDIFLKKYQSKFNNIYNYLIVNYLYHNRKAVLN
jgi:hypothetical protein